MASWSEIEADVPEFAARVREVPTDSGYRVDIGEVAVTRLGSSADHLVIESWHPGRGYERRTRA